jgi:hypothetical protein
VVIYESEYSHGYVPILQNENVGALSLNGKFLNKIIAALAKLILFFIADSFCICSSLSCPRVIACKN